MLGRDGRHEGRGERKGSAAEGRAPRAGQKRQGRRRGRSAPVGRHGASRGGGASHASGLSPPTFPMPRGTLEMVRSARMVRSILGSIAAHGGSASSRSKDAHEGVEEQTAPSGHHRGLSSLALQGLRGLLARGLVGDPTRGRQQEDEATLSVAIKTSTIEPFTESNKWPMVAASSSLNREAQPCFRKKS